MRTDRRLAALALLVALTAAARAEPTAATDPIAATDAPASTAGAADGPLALGRFTFALPAEVTVVGLTYGVRPEVLYRPGPRGSRSRLRLALGVLDGPEQLFVPASLGYRAIFRPTRRVRPELGAGVEVQHRLVSDFPAVRQYGVYVESGVAVAVTHGLTIGVAVAIDVMLWGGPGAGLGPRLVVGWTP